MPDFFNKVLYNPTGEKKMLAFVIPNEKTSLSYIRYVVPVDFVEDITGIDFFPELENSVENFLEQWSFI